VGTFIDILECLHLVCVSRRDMVDAALLFLH
jgi:hypothetical protein